MSSSINYVSRLPTKDKSEAFCLNLDGYKQRFGKHISPLFSHRRLSVCIAVLKSKTATFKLDYIRLFTSKRRSSWISCKWPPYWFCKNQDIYRMVVIQETCMGYREELWKTLAPPRPCPGPFISLFGHENV